MGYIPYEPYIFRMPDEVIDELYRADIGDIEYEDQYDHDYESAPTYQSKTTKCNRCGFKGLAWADTKFGGRYVYRFGPMAGKIHACMSEVQ